MIGLTRARRRHAPTNGFKVMRYHLRLISCQKKPLLPTLKWWTILRWSHKYNNWEERTLFTVCVWDKQNPGRQQRENTGWQTVTYNDIKTQLRGDLCSNKMHQKPSKRHKKEIWGICVFKENIEGKIMNNWEKRWFLQHRNVLLKYVCYTEIASWNKDVTFNPVCAGQPNDWLNATLTPLNLTLN